MLKIPTSITPTCHSFIEGTVIQVMSHGLPADRRCCTVCALVLQSSMEVAADRRREVELLRQQLGDSEAVLQEQRGASAVVLASKLARNCRLSKSTPAALGLHVSVQPHSEFAFGSCGVEGL